jgi:hypothetical protein
LGGIHPGGAIAVTVALQELSDKVKTLAGDWTKYSVLGGFALYALGYLVLRFHLTSMGIGTDLAVLDERYVFTGARFLVYLVAMVPNVLLIALPAVLALYALSRLVPAALRTRAAAWWSGPLPLAATGVVLSLLLIQLVMRKCFLFTNLLLARQLPVDAGWMSRLLLDDALMPLYFSRLVAGCALSIGLLLAVRGQTAGAGRTVSVLGGILAALVVIQLLLLPVNYGILVVDMSLPRVTALGDTPLADGEQAWLVWEGKDGITWLVRRKSGRTLLTLPRADAKKVEITSYDPIVPALFAEQKDGMR